MQARHRTIAALGNEPPLVGGGRNGPPARREVSARWLSGTVLTGVTSSVLMGVALFAALDGREQLATPPEAFIAAPLPPRSDGDREKAGRVVAPRTLARATDRRRMEVSTVLRDGDRDVVRTMPFVHVNMALAAGHTTSRNYPGFDPLEVFAEDGAAQTATTGLIYGARVESEVSLRTVDFPLETANFDETSDLTAEEVEEVVRTTAAVLTDGVVHVAALHYLDPARFGQSSSLLGHTLNVNYGARILQENMSVTEREPLSQQAVEYAEDLIPFTSETAIVDAFTEAGYSEDLFADVAEALTTRMDAEELPAGSLLRVGIQMRGEESRIMRVSVYGNSGRSHLLTVAVDDAGQVVLGSEPEINPQVVAAFEGTPAVHRRGDLPTVYDGIYRAAYSYGLNSRLTRQLVRLLASEVDYQARLEPNDRIEVFFSRPDEDHSASDESELLYVHAQFGGGARSFYRFQMDDGTIDYFDAEGRSARQFLLRNPVPNGRFTSGFGMRRHPILGYSRMHAGVDWAAPRGTAIIASGNGVVERAGWAGGNGRMVVIRHSNGYETSYSHMSAIADGIAVGGRIRQGQVIGQVGATGLATGNHLHYELSVNGNRVDPMRVRLPVSRELKGDEMDLFDQERRRIDEILREENGTPIRVASAGGSE